MKKLMLAGLLLMGTIRAEPGLIGAFKQVCEAGVCFIKKNADAVYAEYKKNIEPFISKTLREVTAPIGLDLGKLIGTSQKMVKDIEKLKKDLDLLAKQTGTKGTTFFAASNIVEAADRFDDEVIALQRAKPPYSNTELVTAITGVPSAIEWLWGGRSQDVKKHFDKMIAEYGVVRDNIPLLDVKILVERAQIVISELVYIMDDITDIRTSTGKISDTFISSSLTTNFRALREDLARVTARMGTIAQLRSYIVGGPYDNFTMAKKVGSTLITNIFQIGALSSTIMTIKRKIDEIKQLSDTLKEEGAIIDEKGKGLDSASKMKPLMDRIKQRVTQSNILEINRIALEEIQRTVGYIRETYQDIILLSLTMIEQVAVILDNAQVIGVNTDSMFGGTFVQPLLIENISGMSDDLRDIRKRSEAMIRELKLLNK